LQPCFISENDKERNDQSGHAEAQHVDWGVLVPGCESVSCVAIAVSEGNLLESVNIITQVCEDLVWKVDPQSQVHYLGHTHGNEDRVFPVVTFLRHLKPLVNCRQVAFDENSERSVPKKCISKLEFDRSVHLAALTKKIKNQVGNSDQRCEATGKKHGEERLDENF
jgi:hypothetical protein